MMSKSLIGISFVLAIVISVAGTLGYVEVTRFAQDHELRLTRLENTQFVNVPEDKMVVLGEWNQGGGFVHAVFDHGVHRVPEDAVYASRVLIDRKPADTYEWIDMTHKGEKLKLTARAEYDTTPESYLHFVGKQQGFTRPRHFDRYVDEVFDAQGLWYIERDEINWSSVAQAVQLLYNSHVDRSAFKVRNMTIRVQQ